MKKMNLNHTKNKRNHFETSKYNNCSESECINTPI